MNLSSTKPAKKNVNLREAFVLACESLLPCDIIFSAEHSKLSKLVRSATDGDYSHVMLNLGGSLIHADSEGVFTENPQRLFFDSKESVAVLRLKQPLSDQPQKIIIEYARNKVGSLYSVNDAISTVLPLGAFNPKKQFCSRLVAQAYAAAGIQIVKNINFCTPEDIFSSRHLVKLDNVSRHPTEEEFIVASKPNRVKENQKSLYFWLNKARTLAKKVNFEIGSENDAFFFIINHNAYSDEVCTYVQQSGYLDNYLSDKESNPYRFSEALCIEMYNAHPQKTLLLLVHDAEQEYRVCERHIIEIQATRTYPESSFTALMLKLHYDILDFSINKLRVMNNACKYFNKNVDCDTIADLYSKALSMRTQLP